MAVLLSACGHRASQQTEETADDSTEVARPAGFAVDSISHVQEDSIASVNITVDWPVSGNDSLMESIRHYICEEMAVNVMQEGEREVKYNDDGKKAVDEAFKRQYDQLMAMRNDVLEDNELIPIEMTYSFYLRVKMLEEGEKYVTYLTNGEGFLGGAHGYATSTGVTFRKSDGKRIGYTKKYNRTKDTFSIVGQTMFKEPRTKELNTLLKEGIKNYFIEFQEEPITDEDLRDQLLDVDLNNIPLPANPPIFTKDGLSFTYQQYEIAAYAAGMPNFIIPYEKISNCLTDDAKSLIP